MSLWEELLKITSISTEDDDKTNSSLLADYENKLAAHIRPSHYPGIAQHVYQPGPTIGGQNGNWQSNQAVHSGSVNPAGYGPGALASVTATGGTITGITYSGIGPAYQSGPGIPAGNLIYITETDRLEERKPVENAGVKVGEIIGWRIWTYKKGYLESYSAERIYAPGEPMTADAEEMEDWGHSGVWAFKERSRALQKMLKCNTNGICGSIKMWGKVIEHEIGYRAQFASIVSLDDITMTDGRGGLIGYKEKTRMLGELRKTYGLAA